MTIKRDLGYQADIQSFAVSNGSILVPFVHETSINTWNKRKNAGNIDHVNMIVHCIPKAQYDELRSKGLLSNNIVDRGKITPKDIDPTLLEGGVLRNFIVNKYLIAVEIVHDNFDINFPTVEELKMPGEYFVEITSDRQYPYVGRFILGGVSAKKKFYQVPKGEGVGEDEIQKRTQQAIDELPNYPDRPDLSSSSSSSIINERTQLLDALFNASLGDSNINAATKKGPHYRDVNRKIIFGHNNHSYIDLDNKKFGVSVAKDEKERLSYDGEAEVFQEKSNLQIHGTPISIYESNGLSENPMQETSHSTFFSPIKRFTSNPMSIFGQENLQILKIIGEFKALL